MVLTSVRASRTWYLQPVLALPHPPTDKRYEGLVGFYGCIKWPMGGGAVDADGSLSVIPVDLLAEGGLKYDSGRLFMGWPRVPKIEAVPLTGRPYAHDSFHLGTPGRTGFLGLGHHTNHPRHSRSWGRALVTLTVDHH